MNAGKNFKVKAIAALLFALFAIALLPALAEAKSVAYILKNTANPVQKYMDVFSGMGFSVSLIDEAHLSSTNFANYDFMFIGDQDFVNPALIPVNQYKALITTSYSDGMNAWHWSKKASSIVSSYPLRTSIIATSHTIVENFTTPIQVYTQCCYQGTLGIPASFLSRFDKSGYLTVVTSTTNNENDGIIITAVPGTRLKDGFYANAKGAFFGITETEYWTPEAEQLFRQTIIWLSKDDVSPIINLVQPEPKVYNTNLIPVEFTSSEPVSCTYHLDSGAETPITSPSTITAAEGSHTLVLTCLDSSSNPATATRAFSVDTVSPVVTITSPIEGYYSSNSVALSASTDSAVSSCTYSLNGAANVSMTGSGVSWASSFSALQSDNNVIVYCRDSAGNIGSSARHFVIDTTLPVITGARHSPIAPLDTDFVTIYATITDANMKDAKAYYRVNGGEWSFAPMASGAEYSALIGKFSNHDNVEYYITASDLAGNIATSGTLSFVVSASDTTPPGAPINPTAFYQAGGSIRLEWQAPEGSAARYNIYITDNLYSELSSFDFSKPNATVTTLSWTDAQASSVSRRFYVVRAEDSSKNEEKNTFRFGKFDIPLKAGMNLVSLPLIPRDKSIKAVMHETAESHIVFQVMNRKSDGNYEISEFFLQNAPDYWWSDSTFSLLDNGRG
ncbi:MAG: hypothetical protein NTV63_01330, partial [Candidatus Woesearchaeota archaeon]|nr:hypothetical protein [Candidatus Woesearchaeota archaeon]